MAENNEERGFSVKDKRIFSEKGEVRQESLQEDEKQEPEEKVVEAKEEEKREEKSGEKIDKKAKAIPLPEINFPSFILSLHTSALFNFGDMHDPASGKKIKNLPAAKQTIDILGILKEKTSGNLDQYEQRLLEGALYELRMRYIKETEKK